MNRPKDEANEDEKKGESDRHEGAQPVEKRYRRIITLAHLTMITMILEMKRKLIHFLVQTNCVCMVFYGITHRQKIVGPLFKRLLLLFPHSGKAHRSWGTENAAQTSL